MGYGWSRGFTSAETGVRLQMPVGSVLAQEWLDDMEASLALYLASGRMIKPDRLAELDVGDDALVKAKKNSYEGAASAARKKKRDAAKDLYLEPGQFLSPSHVQQLLKVIQSAAPTKTDIARRRHEALTGAYLPLADDGSIAVEVHAEATALRNPIPASADSSRERTKVAGFLMCLRCGVGKGLHHHYGSKSGSGVPLGCVQEGRIGSSFAFFSREELEAHGKDWRSVLVDATSQVVVSGSVPL
ncbi:hypothetical protein JCM11641_008058 [Rhodosporidiobolus odoratus]